MPAAAGPGGLLRGDPDGVRTMFVATEVASGVVVSGDCAMEVLARAGRPAEVDSAALHEYLATGRLVGGPRTLLKHVHAIPRGWCARRRGAEIELLEDPDLAEGPKIAPSRVPWAQALRDALARSLAESTAGSGAAIALSGGIDSSGLLALVARQSPNERVDAFCYVAEPGELPPGSEELPWAERAAEACGARLHRVRLVPGELPDRVAAAVMAQGFPFASPVIVAQTKVFAAMADAGYRLALGGHGPEILFGGTTPHAALRAAQLLRGGNVLAAGRLVSGAARRLGVPPRHLGMTALGCLLGVRPLRPPGGPIVPWGSQRWFSERAVARERPRAIPREAARLIDELLASSMGATSLLHEARNAAAAGLDNRQPYLLPPVVALARALPAEECISPDGVPKQVLRAALRGLVPDEILGRGDRIGFAVPALPWLLGAREWSQSRIRELPSLPFFDGPSFADTWAALEAGGARGWATAWRVWRWIALLEWATARNARFE